MDSRFVTRLNGKDYPLYAGVLDAAHKEGLVGIEVEPIQFPTEENGMVAICRAIVTMKNGSKFAEVGDASPRNTNSKISTALIRMSATRAKGRALRDAVNVGQTLLEELPDLDAALMDDHTPGMRPSLPLSEAKAPVRSEPLAELDCRICGQPVTSGRATYCTQNGKSITHTTCEGKQ